MCTALDYRGVRIGENGALSSNTKPKPVRTARTLHSGRFLEIISINYVRQTNALTIVPRIVSAETILFLIVP